jgi:glycosyltransferase involved in cell wall biosynthesis
MWHLNAGGLTLRSGAAACAFAQGLPIIAFSGHSLDSRLQDGQNVLLVNERNAESLACATQRLVKSPELQLRLSSAAKQLHDEVLAWPVVAEGHLELLRRLGVRLG